MKRFGILSSTILLSGLLLLCSGGITIGKIICGDNECYSAYTIGYSKDCCSKNNASKKIKSCCCELIEVSYLLDNFNFSQRLKAPVQEFYFFLPLADVSLAALNQVEGCHSLFLPGISPPDTKEFLIFISSLLL